ncbi:MAG: DUF222 domain-containing protein, partial [Candidatus Dormibacteraeota bacterium]|nr:DUF222 domain-containing protein [Candidatus Dormibacteraeota bacterium]
MSYETSRELAAHGLQGVYAPDATLAALVSAVDAAGVAPTPRRRAWQLIGDMKLRQQCIDRLQLQQARDAAAFAATEEYEFHGSASPADWIRHNTKVSGMSASISIRVGEQMASLPRSVVAMREGQIGFAHLALMSSTAAAVTEASDAPPFDEQPLLDKACDHSVGRFSHDCHNARHAADAAGFLSEQRTAIEWRSFDMNPVAGGFVLRGRLDSAGGAVLRSAIEALAKKQGPEDTRRAARRRGDAVIELANHGLDAGTLPSQGGQRPHVQVTTTLETLMGVVGAPAGGMQLSEPVSFATVQRLACESSLTRILVDAKSAILDVGRATRVPSAALRRALQARDGGCIWPGCDRPISWTAAHHFKHWARGGPTALDNLGS